MEREKVLTSGGRRPVQQQRIAAGWTPSRRAQFLDHVAATCNVRAATEAVGLTQASVYALRRRDVAFAEQWRMALLAGYDRLEEMLVSKAIAALEDVPAGDPDKVVTGPISVEQAIRLLDRHQALVKQGTGRREAQLRATQAETDAMLIKRIKAMRGKLERRT
ncbi:hypothetical protein ASE90_09995 [Sphingomonas sp. Leaf67]|uniref:hypothetical protein n=1 Tax=unclassified Sphingomonas TaxID=196159 RepID=UPI0006F371CE|nr:MULTISPECIES: hypothetical protein [unclassified Sphingomonas]KQN80122.1 hypothetical protein ASE91_12915 [Sphingomonas sp. Leaf62]KQN82031.1 hypothetical protein ASE90_09995 [Sphingomonas sp. Leaf67]